jgi:hypothetical protein
MADSQETATGTATNLDNALPGDLDDVMSELGLEPETPEERAAMAAGRDPGKAREQAAAKRAEGKGDTSAADDEDARAGKKDESKAKSKDDEAHEESDEAKALADWEAAKKRARARRSAAREPVKAAPVAAAPAKADEKTETPTADKVAAAPAKTAAESTVKALVADVIRAIEGIDDADEAAAAGATDKKTLGAVAAREANLAAVKEKLASLAEVIEGAKSASAKERDDYADAAKELRQRVQDLDDTQFVSDLAEKTIDRMETKLPLLSKHRNASKLVVHYAGKFLEKHGKAAPLGFIAERVERVLSRRSGDTGEGAAPARGAPTKQQTSRKTTSASLNTPPSRRKDPDTRTPQQVEDDLAAAFPEYRD